MNIIYLFSGENEVKIPMLGYNNFINNQLTQLGGVFDDKFFGFIFYQKIDPDKFVSLFGIICIITNNVPKYFGLLELSNEDHKIKHNELTRFTSDDFDQSIFVCKKQEQLDKLPEQILDKLLAEFRARKYSLNTQRAYIYYIRLLCSTLKKSPDKIHPDDVTEFLAIMENKRGFSSSSLNLAISAVKFFFRYIIKENNINERQRPNNNKTLPMVLSTEEIINILGKIKNPKHRLLLMLVYSSGLRVSEVVALKKEHIDLSRRVIFIKLGKGRKDRYTMLSDKAADFIKQYYEQYKIDKWIFPGQSGVKHLTIRSAQRIFENAVRGAGITKEISIHGLRHTFATHLLENGTDIRYIQTLLGHSNVRTTERYTHVAKRNVLNIKSPLDSI